MKTHDEPVVSSNSLFFSSIANAAWLSKADNQPNDICAREGITSPGKINFPDSESAITTICPGVCPSNNRRENPGNSSESSSISFSCPASKTGSIFSGKKNLFRKDTVDDNFPIAIGSTNTLHSEKRVQFLLVHSRLYSLRNDQNASGWEQHRLYLREHNRIGWFLHVCQPACAVDKISVDRAVYRRLRYQQGFSCFLSQQKASHGHLAHVVFITGITPRPIFFRYRSKHRTPVCKKISCLYGMKPEHKFVILHKNTLFRSISITGSE